MTAAGAGDDRLAVPFAATGYYRLHLPPGLPPGPAPLLVAFHGYGQPPEEMFAWARGVAPPGTIVLAPEGPSSFYRDPRRPKAEGGVGHGWVADPRRADQDRRNDGLVEACLAALSRVHPPDPSRTVLLGYSQGVGVAVHAWCSRPGLAAALVGVAGGVNAVNRPRLPLLRGRPVLWVSGARDGAYPPAYTEEMVASLRAAGVALETAVLPAGHALLEPARDLVRSWLAPRLAGASEPANESRP